MGRLRLSERMGCNMFSSNEISYPLESALHGINVKYIVPKSFTRFGYLNQKRGNNGSVKKASVFCHLVGGNLEGSFVGRKKLNDPSLKSEFLRTLLIDNYDSYTYNIYQELAITNGVPPVVIRNDEWTWEDVCHYLYEEKAFDNIVISPGPGSPTCAADIGICLRVLLECKDIPILGVCLGHQALGYVHGAQVIHAPEPIHGRLSEIEHNGCGLFHGIPSGRGLGFKVVRYHSLIIDPHSLPKELIPIAWTCSPGTSPSFGIQNFDSYLNGYDNQMLAKSKDGHMPNSQEMQPDKILMGIMHSSRPHYALQFHPESIATCHGRQLFKNFADITRDYAFRMKPSLNSKKNNHYADVSTENLVHGFDKNRDSHRNLTNPSHSKNAKLLKLKWRKVECSTSQVGGAGNMFCELFGNQEARNTFWLDSSSTEKNRARFSFMGGKGGDLWRQLTFRLSNNSGTAFNRGGGYLLIEDSEGSSTSTYLKDGFFDFLSKEFQSFHYDATDYEGLPFDFYGGYIGYFGYDLKVECGAVSNQHKSRPPDACLFFADNLVVIDHLYDDIYIMSISSESTRQSPWLDDTEQKLLKLKLHPWTKSAIPMSRFFVENSQGEGFLAKKTREQYMNDVEKCQRFIKDGESYELCLTTQMTRRVGDIYSLGFYLHLREKNPAPYAAWLNFAKQNLSICCSSPERFLRLDRNGILEAKPIKGTIARGSSADEDEARKLKLQYSEKDQAENLMIVDLLRNDLGCVSEPGSVNVPHLMDIESYATVHTMVSTIQGKKRSDVSAIECIQAAFPGGSMTGAPKLRSMEILDSLEDCSRGIYSGCIGYISYNQTFDLNIVIRSIILHQGEASIGSGGAITALSISKDEYEEMVLKTRAPTKAVTEYLKRNSTPLLQADDSSSSKLTLKKK